MDSDLEVLILIPAALHSAANRSSESWRSRSDGANRTTSSAKSSDPILSNRHSCAPLGLPVPACCLRSPTGQKGPIGLLQFDGICRHGRHRPPCGHSSVSKTCGRKSDNTTIKSIIELRPRVSWCQAQTTVRIRPPTQRRREATLSSTGVNSNIQAPSQGAVSIATPARRLSPVATPEWKRVQPLSRRLVPEPLLCVEVRPTISSRNFSTLRTSSGSFPTREVTFHIPRASFCSRGSDRQGPCLRPLPSSHCTRPLWPLPLVVSLREGGPTSSLRSVPVPMGPGQQALTPEPHPQAWLQGGGPGSDKVLDSKSKVDLERLPPPKVCLIPHVQRANYRVACYKRADEEIIESPKPYPGMGWEKTGEEEVLEPVWTIGPILPPSLVERRATKRKQKHGRVRRHILMRLLISTGGRAPRSPPLIAATEPRSPLLIAATSRNVSAASQERHTAPQRYHSIAFYFSFFLYMFYFVCVEIAKMVAFPQWRHLCSGEDCNYCRGHQPVDERVLEEEEEREEEEEGERRLLDAVLGNKAPYRHRFLRTATRRHPPLPIPPFDPAAREQLPLCVLLAARRSLTAALIEAVLRGAVLVPSTMREEEGDDIEKEDGPIAARFWLVWVGPTRTCSGIHIQTGVTECLGYREWEVQANRTETDPPRQTGVCQDHGATTGAVPCVVWSIQNSN
ncbi:hypothetical protein N1851_012564 [Merluccius polli]|uniref:Uncharacterized protein n=1 Tax=Merluccius polli TaxID=89951 RepID=A0AA47MX80_MERPO|nr:hypothetical protein N1851_012564 [Merluccius polli]